MDTLYPPPQDIQRTTLSAGRHRLHVETSGNPRGLPVLFLHGGPGSGCRPHHHRFFNPQHYHIILLDQRGCGRSQPHGGLQDNTTWHLIDDIEALRTSLNISSWMLFGGSWGAALALVYAQHYPRAVSSMILRGSFLARKADLHWLTQRGANRHFPLAWQQFSNAVNDYEQHDMVSAYYQRLCSDDHRTQLMYAKLWETWSSVVTLGRERPSPSSVSLSQLEEKLLIEKASIALHYAYHDYFLDQHPIADHLHQLPQVPIKIIHGRDDYLCRLSASETLAKHLPWASMSRVNNGGHLAEDSLICRELVKATDAFAQNLVFD
ncbi:prolyl aminopeptidase [Spongiibacter nanhainus]|nr:prolyl aminopeptidase [Spongiibacter nanhainus]